LQTLLSDLNAAWHAAITKPKKPQEMEPPSLDPTLPFFLQQLIDADAAQRPQRSAGIDWNEG